MSILSDAVFCSKEWNGRGIFSFDRIPFRVKMILKSTTKRQISKFRKKRIVPVPVLEALFLLGFMPGEEEPKDSMTILALTEYLECGLYRTEQTAKNGSWLYHRIVSEEIIGS